MTLSVTKGYKYRLYPTKEQALYLNQTLGACRKIWNVLLDQSIKEYDAYRVDTALPKPNVSAFTLTEKIPTLKAQEDLNWLRNYPAVALQQKVSIVRSLQLPLTVSVLIMVYFLTLNEKRKS